jgi:hypothetical protein
MTFHGFFDTILLRFGVSTCHRGIITVFSSGDRCEARMGAIKISTYALRVDTLKDQGRKDD